MLLVLESPSLLGCYAAYGGKFYQHFCLTLGDRTEWNSTQWRLRKKWSHCVTLFSIDYEIQIFKVFNWLTLTTYVMRSSQAATCVISKQNHIVPVAWSAAIVMTVLCGLRRQGVITWWRKQRRSRSKLVRLLIWDAISSWESHSSGMLCSIWW